MYKLTLNSKNEPSFKSSANIDKRKLFEIEKEDFFSKKIIIK